LSTYVDTSTLIKLLIDEAGSDRAGEIWDREPSLVSVALVEVEARSALAAANRADRLTDGEHRRAKRALPRFLGQMDLVGVTTELVSAAAHLAEREALRGYDAVHLAAALLADAEVLTSADARLLDAASRRGLLVADPLGGS
jgi:hypothetical protein